MLNGIILLFTPNISPVIPKIIVINIFPKPNPKKVPIKVIDIKENHIDIFVGKSFCINLEINK